MANLLIFNYTLSVYLHFNNSGGVTSGEGISEVLLEELLTNRKGITNYVLVYYGV